MPIHDWTRVSAGILHHSRQAWAAELTKSLNAGRPPRVYFALLEQRASGTIPDVLTLQSAPRGPKTPTPGGVSVMPTPPTARFVIRADTDTDVARANRVVVRNPLGQIVAVIEIVSPGNKSSQTALRAFVDKSVEFLQQGIHLLVIDLFPPTPRAPRGIHKAIWDEIEEPPFDPPKDKPLKVAAYDAGVPKTVYVEPLAVGDPLPALPIFLDDGAHVSAPLDESYEATWDACPQPLKDAVGGNSP